jgi:hypothetical protein
MAKQKMVVVEAFLPELPSGHAHQESRGTGSSLAVALGRAVDELVKLPHVKGRRLTSLKLTVAVVME